MLADIRMYTRVLMFYLQMPDVESDELLQVNDQYHFGFD